MALDEFVLIDHTPVNYTTSGNDVTDHIVGLDSALANSGVLVYDNRPAGLDVGPVSVGANEDFSIVTGLNLISGRYLKVTGATSTNTTIEIFADAARTRLLYRATGKDLSLDPHIDPTPFALFDDVGDPEAKSLYFRISNVAGADTTYNVTLVAAR